MPRHLFLSAILIGAGLLPTSIAQELRAGAATSNITPWLGLPINGSMSPIESKHVHDELHVRCLVIDDGSTKFAFAVCDSCAVPRSIVEDAKQQIQKQTGIPADCVLISATHSHSAGSMTEAFQSPTDLDYQKFVANRIADGVRRALNNLEPARIGWATANAPEHLNNRRWKMKEGTIPPSPFGTVDHVRMNPQPGSPDLVEPAGPVDPQLSLIWAESHDGRKIALLANYGLHYVGGVGPGHLSADYYGYFAKAIAQRLNAEATEPPFVGIMSNGTSGDVNNINFRTPQPGLPPYEKIKQVANEVAHTAFKTYGPGRGDIKISVRAAELQLGVRKPTPEELSRAEKIVAEAGGIQAVMQTLEQIYARETVLISKYPDTVPVTIQALRIGDVGIVAIPCEVFAEIGLEIKAKSPLKPTFIIELANGYNGYLPTPAQHALGGYETWRARSSYLETSASEKIVATVLDLLKSL